MQDAGRGQLCGEFRRGLMSGVVSIRPDDNLAALKRGEIGVFDRSSSTAP